MKKRFPYYPIFIDIEDRDVVIIGGGAVCARKAETVLRYGARVTVVAPEVSEDLAAAAAAGRLSIRKKKYDAADLDDAWMVIASTDDPCVNGRIARDCRRRRIPVNVVDVTHLCQFIVPAIVEQGSVQLAVSTGGRSPALARTLKEELQKFVGPEYAEVNDVLGTLRAAAKKTLPTDRDRKRFFDGIIERGVLSMLREGRRREAYQAIAHACQQAKIPISDRIAAELQSGR